MARKKKLQHYKDTDALKVLGQHCRKLRIQRGYSIDRLAKESDRLSPSVIHRLEKGLGPVSVLAIIRYASALRILPKTLFDVELSPLNPSQPQAEELPKSPLILSPTHSKVKSGRFKTLLPLYSLKAAVGCFSAGEEITPEGWIEISEDKKLDPQMFVARAVGNSMQPKIRSGDYLVFRANPGGSRQGKIVLAQYRGPADPETGGSYTVKQYQSSKVLQADGSWRHRQVMLLPLDPEYEPIILNTQDERDFQIIAEYLFTVTLPG